MLDDFQMNLKEMFPYEVILPSPESKQAGWELRRKCQKMFGKPLTTKDFRATNADAVWDWMYDFDGMHFYFESRDNALQFRLSL